MFREQITFLMRNYTPISILDFLTIMDEKGSIRSYARPPVLLGFDDGFRSVITNGLPILSEFGIPAVVFVVAKAITTPQFVPWFLEMRHILRKTTQDRVVYDGLSVDLTSERNRGRLGRLVDARFRACRSEVERDRLITDFATLLDVKRPVASELDEDLALVNTEDLVHLDDSSVLTVGSHAMTHRFLASLTYEEQLYELQESDAVLRDHCHSYRSVVAYPAGSFNATTLDIASRIYAAGFAVSSDSSYRNRYAYPRLGLAQGNARDLAYLLSPFRLNYLLPLKRAMRMMGYRRGE